MSEAPAVHDGKQVVVQLINILLEALGDVIGGMAIALVIAFAFWNLFKLVHHPELGPVVSFAIVTAVLATTHRTDRIMPMIVLFSLVAIVCSWSEGAAWRARRTDRNRNITLPTPGLPKHRHHPR